jgi:hypothetical protein
VNTNLSAEVLSKGGFHSLAGVFGEGRGASRILIFIKFSHAVLAGTADGIQLLLELPAGRADPPVNPGAHTIPKGDRAIQVP